MTVGIRDLNRLSRQEFTDFLGTVFEHSPWVAESAWTRGPFDTVDDLHAAMMEAVAGAPERQVLELIRAHPDLATRLGIGSLTAFSAKEQQGAGLDRLTPEEFETFSSLNGAYTEKFGFPFIFAVRGKGKDDILAAMRKRIGHTAEEERREALEQIRRIAGFRLRDLISD